MSVTCKSTIMDHDLLRKPMEVIEYNDISYDDAKKALKFFPWFESLYDPLKKTLYMLVLISADKYRG